MDAGSGRLFGLLGQCVDAREIQTESPGDFFGGEKAPGKEGPDDPVLFFAGSLPDSLLNAFLGRFLEHLIDDVGGHAFRPEDGDKLEAVPQRGREEGPEHAPQPFRDAEGGLEESVVNSDIVHRACLLEKGEWFAQNDGPFSVK